MAAVALSPSGDMLALVNPRRLAVVRVDGSDYRELSVVPAGSNLLPSVRWAGDGRSLLFTIDGPKQSRMMRIAVTGGQPEPGGLVGTNAVRFDVSPMVRASHIPTDVNRLKCGRFASANYREGNVRADPIPDL